MLGNIWYYFGCQKLGRVERRMDSVLPLGKKQKTECVLVEIETCVCVTQQQLSPNAWGKMPCPSARR